MKSCYNLRTLVVDLSAERCEELEMEAEELHEAVGGAAYNLKLYHRFPAGEPFIIGTGPLTASFAPASCFGVATALSPLTNKVAHVPLTWQSAVEMKLAGFDFLVITGAASKPLHLWLHDEIAELEDAAVFMSENLWETVDALRQAHGDMNVKTIAPGPAGLKGNLAARLAENYWPARDTFALGAALGRKNLVAIAIRGLGYFETDLEAFHQLLRLREPLQESLGRGQTGLERLLDILPEADAARAILEKYTHRTLACFHCPSPCQPFLMCQGDPREMKVSPHDQPGVLLTVLPDLLALCDRGDEAPALIAAAARQGVNPALDDGQKVVPPWPGLDSPLVREIRKRGVLSTAVPPVLPAGNPAQSADEILFRQALAYVSGICPVFLMLCPDLDAQMLAMFITAWCGEEMSAEKISAAAQIVLRAGAER